MGESLIVSPQVKDVLPSPIGLQIPPSKSHTMRALLLGALLPGKSKIKGILPSPDTTLLLQSLERLGAKITKGPSEEISIKGAFPWREVDAPLYVGNSGIQLRFLTALASLFPHRYVISGDETLSLMRPVDDLLNGLSQLGGRVEYLGKRGRAPFAITGPIHSGRVDLKGGDSQQVSALLLALSFLKEKSEIRVEDPQEIPWVKMTLGWLKRLGALVYASDDHRYYRIERGIDKSSFNFDIPSDYSSLSYPFAMSLVARVPMQFFSFPKICDEGDAAFLHHVKEDLSGDFHFEEDRLIPSLDWGWQSDRIDLSNCIDLTSLFAVLATRSNHPILIEGIKGAKEKECDRLLAIAKELSRMNGSVEIRGDSLYVKPSNLKGTVVDSWGDHRMVLALSIAAMMAEGETIIRDATCILKSYPCYVSQMQSLGFDWRWE